MQIRIFGNIIKKKKKKKKKRKVESRWEALHFTYFVYIIIFFILYTLCAISHKCKISKNFNNMCKIY